MCDVIKNQKGAVVFLLVSLETFSFTTSVPTFSPAHPRLSLTMHWGAEQGSQTAAGKILDQPLKNNS